MLFAIIFRIAMHAIDVSLFAKDSRKKTMRLVLVRHAQSANNALPDHQRVHDPGLTDLGLEQAEQLGAWMKSMPITALWCSPFKRSLDTTEAIRRRCSLTPYVHIDLHELGGCYSGYQAIGRQGEAGMGASELRKLYPAYEIDSQITEDGWWFRKPFESQSLCDQRTARVIDWFKSQLKHATDYAVAVIHADFKRLILKQMLSPGLDVENLGPIFNASATALRWDGKAWTLDFFNSISHLPYSLHSE
jgi:2,3-bisphosphoglycerate-dependent phosphoglycerate mutase